MTKRAALDRVFVSHTDEDRQIALDLSRLLTANGYETWLYERDTLPGVLHLDQVHSAIHVSSAFAILISIPAFASPYVTRELYLAAEFGKPIFPLLVGLSHAALRHPDRASWHTALCVATSIEVPPDGVAPIESRILDGLKTLIVQHAPARRKRVAPPATAPSATTPTPAPTVEDPWAALARRIETFEPGIANLRRDLQRQWADLNDISYDAGDVRALALERANLIDAIVRDLFDVVDQQGSQAPRSLACVARGGYGLGMLSLGSDVDITLLHDTNETAATETFYIRFSRGLSDICSAVGGLSPAPAITTYEQLVTSWRAALRGDPPGDFCALVSFAFSRPIAGDPAAEKRLRQAWTDLVLRLTAAELQSIRNRLLPRVESKHVSPEDLRFDLKEDAGGILEYRLRGFLDQVLSLHGIAPEPSLLDLADAHRFLLLVRDAVFAVVGTHVLTQRETPRVASLLAPSKGHDCNVPGFLQILNRHRRRIRRGLTDTLVRIESLISAISSREG